MVCSACGFENPTPMRFCGMCGMPLPHRPMTAPGAQSTLNLTRVPVETQPTGRERNPGSEKSARVALDSPAADLRSSEREYKPGSSTASEVAVASPEESQPKELVPDVPLNEYIENFHYEPPREPAEVTMRGETHLTSHEVEYPKPEPAKPADNIAAPSRGNYVRADVEDVDRRLGLEPESPVEANIARPRFLDINEPSNEAAPVASGTSISGPSFLGLNDPPQTWAEAVGVEYTPSRYSWRVFVALAIACIVLALVALEWRSQTAQTATSAIEVVRGKIRDFRHRWDSDDDLTKPATSSDANSNAKPQSGPNGEAAWPVKNAANSASTDNAANAPAQAGATQPSPQPTSPAPQADNGQSGTASPESQTAQNPTSPPAASADQTSSTPAANSGTTVADNSASKPAADKSSKKKQADAADQQEVVTKQSAPGADEMNKAKDASDAAATAAWLWKATAKGNPEAPVQLANMYIQGNGVPRSCEQAVVLLKTAGAKQNAGARNRLAWMYSTGTCVPRNRMEAYRWLNSALDANPNSQWAKQNRDLLWQQMTPEERAGVQRGR